MAKTIADRPEGREAELKVLRGAGTILTCARLLIEAGLSLRDFQWVIDDPDGRERLAAIWGSGCKETTTSQLVAAGIMGPNMIGLEGMLDCYGIAFSAQRELSDLATIPFPEEVLRACKETHILFPGYLLSIMKMRKQHPGFFSSRDGRWYDHKPFARDEQVQCRWYLLRKFGTDLDDVLDTEVVPRACEVVFGLILARRQGGQNLFGQNRVACRGMAGEFVYVGFGEQGISIGDNCNDPSPRFASMAK